MHFESLWPLLPYLPLVALPFLALIGLLGVQALRARQRRARWVQYDKRYWATEMAYRARMRFRGMLLGRKVRRLTYIPPAEQSGPGE